MESHVGKSGLHVGVLQRELKELNKGVLVRAVITVLFLIKDVLVSLRILVQVEEDVHVTDLFEFDLSQQPIQMHFGVVDLADGRCADAFLHGALSASASASPRHSVSSAGTFRLAQ